MAGPVATKTWKYYSLNVDADINDPPVQLAPGAISALETCPVRKKMWLLKQALIASPGAWTVLSSCGHNGTNFVYGNTDYWTTAAWLWYQYLGEFSWIVLRNAEISGEGNGFQLLITMAGADPAYPTKCAFYISGAAGFTGGNTTTRPTATDEIMVRTGTETPGWTGQGTHQGGAVFKTSDGQHTRFYVTNAGIGSASPLFYAFEKYESVLSPSLNPYPWLVVKGIFPNYMNLCYGPGTAYAGYSTFVNRYAGTPAHDTKLSRMTVVTYTSYALTFLATYARSHVPDSDGKLYCYPVYLSSPFWTSSGALVETYPFDKSISGKMTDFWMLPTAANDTAYSDLVFPTGDYYPSNTNRRFIVMGAFLQPSDGSVVHLG